MNKIIWPNACKYCNISERGHYRQYDQTIGWHTWQKPDQEQIKQECLFYMGVKNVRSKATSILYVMV